MGHEHQALQRDKFQRILKEINHSGYMKAEKNFASFFRLAWKIIEPSNPLLFNWHHDIIAEYLTACHLGQIRRLIINIPPRYSKSTLATVAFPCWVWAHKPEKRFLFASYSGGLSMKHSIDRRRILDSGWYQRRWGEKVEIMQDQSAKHEFTNSARGHMIATSFTGTVTGKGGNYLIIDDPHNPKRAESNVERARDIDSFDLTLSTRLDDKKRDVMIVIMQRLHSEDLTGHLKSKEGMGAEWHHLVVPAVEEQVKKTYVFPVSKRKKTRRGGDLLHPEREGPKEIEEVRSSLGSYGFAGQYQQRPAPREGGMLKRDNFIYWQTLPTKFQEMIISVDCSYKEKQTADFTAITVWGRVGVQKYLVDAYHKKVGFADGLRAVEAMKGKWPKARRILIEDSANGVAIIEILSKRMTGVTPVRPMRSKTERVAAIEPDHEQRNYLLPQPSLHPWVEDFIEEVCGFPNTPNDDYVDSLTQAGNYFLKRDGRGIDRLITL